MVVQHGAPGVGATKAARSHACLGHLPIGRFMCGLHGRHNAMRPKARQIGGINELPMFDTPGPVALVGLRQLINGIQKLCIGLVADAMHSALKAIHGGPAPDRTSTRLNSSHYCPSRMPSYA